MPHARDHKNSHMRDRILTNFGVTVNFLAVGVSCLYWFARLCDIILLDGFDLVEAEKFGISYISLVPAILLGTWAAGGDSFSHWMLNKTSERKKQLILLPVTEEAAINENEVAIILEKGEEQPLLLDAVSDITPVEKTTTDKKQLMITIAKYFALGGDFLSHLSENAMPVSLIVLRFQHYIQRRYINMALGSIFVLGGMAGLADARTCYRVVLNKHVNEPVDTTDRCFRGDWITLTSTFLGFWATWIATCWWLAQLWDTSLEPIIQQPKTQFNVSIIGAIISGVLGGGIGTLAAIGESYAHYHVNVNYQNKQNISTVAESKFNFFKSLKVTALAGDFIAHTGDSAGPLSSLWVLVLGLYVAEDWTLLATLAITAISAIAAISFNRTCIHNVLPAQLQQ